MRTITHLYLNKSADGIRPPGTSLLEPMSQYKTAAKDLGPKNNFKGNPLGPMDRRTIDHMVAGS